MALRIDSRSETHACALRIAMVASFALAACDSSSAGHTVSTQDAGTDDASAREDTGARDSSNFGSVVGDASADHHTCSALAARPPWTPDLPMGTPGWRNSTVPFCSEDGGGTPLVWSTNERVYVDVMRQCVGESFCASHEILYTNDGSGWQQVYSASDSSPNGITGYTDGRVVLLGSPDCSVKQIDASGNATCLWLEQWPNWTFWPKTAVTTGNDLLVLGNYVDNDTVELRKYDGTQWTSLKTWADPTISGLAVSGTTAIVAGGYQAWHVDLARGTTTLVPNVPAAGYLAVWTYGPTDILLGNGTGGLAHYDGSQWTTLNTMFNDTIGGMWGAPDGTVFMYSQGNFARWSGGSFEPIVMHDVFAGTVSEIFADMWGNSSTEVFLAVHDPDFGAYNCGSLFLLWFDGTNFHQF